MIQLRKKPYNTLPDTSGAFGSMRIPKEPPKEVRAVYKPKLDTGGILCDASINLDHLLKNAVNKYPRGVNQMVSMQYNIYTDSGGSATGPSTQTGTPYKLMHNHGAFIPPLWRLEDILPLSRQPHPNISVCCTATDSNQHKPMNININPKKLRAIRQDLEHNNIAVTPISYKSIPLQKDTRKNINPHVIHYESRTEPRVFKNTPGEHDPKSFQVRDSLKYSTTALPTSIRSVQQKGMLQRKKPERNTPLHEVSCNKLGVKSHPLTPKKYKKLLKRINVEYVHPKAALPGCAGMIKK